MLNPGNKNAADKFDVAPVLVILTDTPTWMKLPFNNYNCGANARSTFGGLAIFQDHA